MYKPTLAQLKILECIRDGWTAQGSFARGGPKIYRNLLDSGEVELKRIASPTWSVLISNKWIAADGDVGYEYKLTKSGEAAIYWAHQ